MMHYVKTAAVIIVVMAIVARVKPLRDIIGM